MADAGFFKGTSADQDRRFSDKELKLLKSMKFPAEFEKKVDMRKVNLHVIRPWVVKKVIELVGFEDEVVVEYAMGLLEDDSQPTPDPRKMQINLTGFLTNSTAEFMTSLWKLLLEAQESPAGVPRTFVEEKKEEMRQSRAGDTRAIEERDRRARLDEIRDSERGGRGGRGRGRGRGRGGFDDDRGGRGRDNGWGSRGGGRPQRRRTPSRSPPRRSPPPRRRRSPSITPPRSVASSRSRSRSRTPPRRYRSRSPPPYRRRSPSRSPPPPRRRPRSPSVTPPPSRDRRRGSRSPPLRRRRISPGRDESPGYRGGGGRRYGGRRSPSRSRSRSRSPPVRRRGGVSRERSPPRRRRDRSPPPRGAKRGSRSPSRSPSRSRSRSKTLDDVKGERGKKTDNNESGKGKEKEREREREVDAGELKIRGQALVEQQRDKRDGDSRSGDDLQLAKRESELKEKALRNKVVRTRKASTANTSGENSTN